MEEAGFEDALRSHERNALSFVAEAQFQDSASERAVLRSEPSLLLKKSKCRQPNVCVSVLHLDGYSALAGLEWSSGTGRTLTGVACVAIRAVSPSWYSAR
jgi:hypothetical protein